MEHLLTLVLKHRRAIWDHAIPQKGRSGSKVLRKHLIGPKVAQWYPIPIKQRLQRQYNLALNLPYYDAVDEDRRAKIEIMRARGKGAPPKKRHK